jgi:hypothetical protein
MLKLTSRYLHSANAVATKMKTVLQLTRNILKAQTNVILEMLILLLLYVASKQESRLNKWGKLDNPQNSCQHMNPIEAMRCLIDYTERVALVRKLYQPGLV